MILRMSDVDDEEYDVKYEVRQLGPNDPKPSIEGGLEI